MTSIRVVFDDPYHEMSILMTILNNQKKRSLSSSLVKTQRHLSGAFSERSPFSQPRYILSTVHIYEQGSNRTRSRSTTLCTRYISRRALGGDLHTHDEE